MGEDTVQDLAEQLAMQRHVGDSPLGIAGSDDQFGGVPGPPHLDDEVRVVRQVCVERQNIVARRGCEPLAQGMAVAGCVLHDDARPARARGVGGAVLRRAVDDHDLVAAAELVEDPSETRQERIDVLALVEDWNDDAQFGPTAQRCGQTAIPVEHLHSRAIAELDAPRSESLVDEHVFHARREDDQRQDRHPVEERAEGARGDRRGRRAQPGQGGARSGMWRPHHQQ
jgi:hypothetical protein